MAERDGAIAEVSREQADGIVNINKTVSQMGSVVQQNASSAPLTALDTLSAVRNNSSGNQAHANAYLKTR